MRTMTTTKLERLFARIVTAALPACAVAGAVACGAVASSNGSPDGGVTQPNDSDARADDAHANNGDAQDNPTDGATLGDGDWIPQDASADAFCSQPLSCCPFLATLDSGLPDANDFDGAVLGPGQSGDAGQSECAALCGRYVFSCTVESAGPPAVVSCQPDCTGRRPAGLRAGASGARSPLGAYFASMTQLEAASVPAFRRMARELAGFGAPRALVRAAERAARDEVRHARAAAAMARRFGARAASFEVDACGARSLEEFAIENAIEGCVRETYGALVATWQARAAGDAQVRSHMQRIARDETAHAALAWKTDAWVRARLGRAARARVDAAREAALRELVDAIAKSEPSAEVAGIAGVPRGVIARELAQGLAVAQAA